MEMTSKIKAKQGNVAKLKSFPKDAENTQLVIIFLITKVGHRRISILGGT